MNPIALSGRPLSDVTMERAVRQDLTPADLRIHPDTLRHQAAVAEEGGNPQLAANLRRAAELTAIDDEELIAVYEALRPMRSSLSQLEAIALRLETVNAVACASLVREAAAYYKTRGLLKLL